VGIQNTSVLKKQKDEYLPRGRNTLHQVFERHFTDFCSWYDEEYADTFGKLRLERIQTVGEHFLTCGAAGTTLELQNALQPAGKYNTRARLELRSLEISKLSRIQTFQMTHRMHELIGKHGHACCQRFTR